MAFYLWIFLCLFVLFCFVLCCFVCFVVFFFLAFFFLLPCTLSMLALAFHVFFHRNRTPVKRTRQKDQKVPQEWGQHTCIAVMNTTAWPRWCPEPAKKLSGRQCWGRKILPLSSSYPPTHSSTEFPRKLWCALFKILQLFSPNLRTLCPACFAVIKTAT